MTEITYKLVVYKNPINDERIYTLEEPVLKEIEGVTFVQGINNLNAPNVRWFRLDSLEKIGVEEWTHRS
jgi:hypothetical protein